MGTTAWRGRLVATLCCSYATLEGYVLGDSWLSCEEIAESEGDPVIKSEIK